MGYTVLIENRKARFDYNIKDKFEAGLSLQGTEVKALKAGEMSLDGTYVQIQEGEVYIKKMGRDIKLLLNKTEIIKISKAVLIKGNTCIITKIYLNKRGLIKAEIAIATGRQNYDKKQYIKEREITKQVDKDI